MTGKGNRLWRDCITYLMMGHPQPFASPKTKVSKYTHPTFSSKFNGFLKNKHCFLRWFMTHSPLSIGFRPSSLPNPWGPGLGLSVKKRFRAWSQPADFISTHEICRDGPGWSDHCRGKCTAPWLKSRREAAAPVVSRQCHSPSPMTYHGCHRTIRNHVISKGPLDDTWWQWSSTNCQLGTFS